MRAVICGAGVGGVALAHGLVHDGWQVTVLERDEHLAEGGAAVTLFCNGMAALDRLGVGDAAALGGAIDRIEFRLADGRSVSDVDLRVIFRRTGFGTRTVPRRALLATVASGLPDDTVRFGVPAVTVSSDGREVVDAAGQTHRPDLVVGADGHRSVVRAATVDATPAASVGWRTWQGLDPLLPEFASGSSGLCVVGNAGLCGLMPAGDGLVQWWFDVPTGGGAEADDLPAHFDSYTMPVPSLLRDLPRPRCFEHRVHTIPDRWSTDTSTLLGDAAHVFPPSQAQGANQALEDAWVLTRCLRDVRDGVSVADCLRRYEAERSRRVRRVSRLAASEVTNRPPSRALRVAARLTPSSVAARAWLTSVRRSSSVLAGPFAAE